MRDGKCEKDDKISAPFYRIMKQEPSRTWLSDAAFTVVAGL